MEWLMQLHIHAQYKLIFVSKKPERGVLYIAILKAKMQFFISTSHAHSLLPRGWFNKKDAILPV